MSQFLEKMDIYGLKNVEADTLATIMTNLWQRELHPFDCSLEGMGTARIIAPLAQ
jgi:hypothetical protein